MSLIGSPERDPNVSGPWTLAPEAKYAHSEVEAPANGRFTKYEVHDHELLG